MISNSTNRQGKGVKREQAATEFGKLLNLVESRGFYGTASLTVCIQDGAIQHLRVAIDRMIRQGEA